MNTIQGLVVRFPRMYLDAFFWWLSSGVSMIFGVLFWMVAARVLQADELGPGAAAIAVVALLSTVSNLGLGLGIVRFLPDAGDKGPRLLNAVMLVGAVVGAAASAVLIVSATLGGFALDVLTAHPGRSLFYVGFVAVDTVLLLQQYALLALRRMDLALVQGAFIDAIRVGCVALIVLAQNAFGIVFAWGVGEAVGVVIGLAVLLPRAYPGYRFALVSLRLPARGLARYALKNHVAHLLTLAPASLLPWLVITETGSDANAAYAYVALAIATAVINISISLALALLAEGSRDVQSLRKHSVRMLLVAFALSALAVAVLFGGSRIALQLFGADYGEHGTGLLRGLLLGALLGAPAQVLIGELRVRKETTKVVVLAAAMNVPMLVLAAVLLPAHGLDAIVIGWLVGNGIGAVAAAVYFIGRRTPQVTRAEQQLVEVQS